MKKIERYSAVTIKYKIKYLLKVYFSIKQQLLKLVRFNAVSRIKSYDPQLKDSPSIPLSFKLAFVVPRRNVLALASSKLK